MPTSECKFSHAIAPLLIKPRCSFHSVRYSGYDVEEIAFHRIVAVSAGTIWGLIVTRFVFPVEARQELRKGLSE